jgi:predicted nucleic acid-binding protein
MARLVLDTDVFSAFYGGRPEVAKLEHHLRQVRPAVTFPTVAEVHYGAQHREWSEQRIRDLDRYLGNFQVLPFAAELPRLWAQLRAYATRAGHPLAHRSLSNDLWIAACAIHYDAPLLTGNTRHFLDVPGLVVLTADN